MESLDRKTKRYEQTKNIKGVMMKKIPKIDKAVFLKTKSKKEIIDEMQKYPES